MRALDAALARHPYDRDLLIAQALYDREAGDAAQALQRAKLLAELEPDNADLRRFAQDLADARAGAPRR